VIETLEVERNTYAVRRRRTPVTVELHRHPGILPGVTDNGLIDRSEN
jgi:hypothetical protein